MKYEATTPRREDFSDLLIFSIISEEQSFTRAASRLGVSKSALSHALRSFEERLGVKLVHRTTRSVLPTEVGQQLVARLKPAFDDVTAALADLHRVKGTAAGRVRINTHREAAVHLILPKLGLLKAQFPEVIVEIAVEDSFTDIVMTGFDAGIRPGERLAKDMKAVRLEPDQRFLVVGSPAYFQAKPAPVKPGDLNEHDCIIYRQVNSKRYIRWKFAKNGRTIQADLEPSLIVNDASMLVQAALDGLGLAYVLERQAVAHVASGALVTVLDDWTTSTVGDFIYFPSDRQMSPALRAVVETLRWRADAAPAGQPGSGDGEASPDC